MSKTYGLPGVRLGYAYTTNRDLKALLEAEIPIWNMNSVAENFLEIILKHKNSLIDSFARTKLDRTNFMTDLQNISAIKKVYESSGNFLMIQLSEKLPNSMNVVESLLNQESIYVKDVSGRFKEAGSKYLRLAVRTEADNYKLVEALKRVL